MYHQDRGIQQKSLDPRRYLVRYGHIIVNQISVREYILFDESACRRIHHSLFPASGSCTSKKHLRLQMGVVFPSLGCIDLHDLPDRAKKYRVQTSGRHEICELPSTQQRV